MEWVLDAALKSHLESIVLVLGYKKRKILEALGEKARRPVLQVAVNDKYSEGLSQSLLAGLKTVQKRFPSVMFLLGDQPMVDSRMINHLLDRFWKSDKDICVPTFQGKRGNPTIFSKNLYNQLLGIKGDVGARNIIRVHPECVLHVEMNILLRIRYSDSFGIKSFFHLFGYIPIYIPVITTPSPGSTNDINRGISQGAYFNCRFRYIQGEQPGGRR